MKKLLIFLLLILSLTVQATTYYVRTTGNNGNPGSISSPWLTVAYACLHTTSGDVINIGAGTFNEGNTQMPLGVGVSIIGQGQASTTIISTRTATRGSHINDASIYLNSSEGTNGNQELKDFTLNGSSLTGTIGIVVNGRSNVSIHSVTITDFFINGITMEGFNSYQSLGTRATGNQIYSCTITNCTTGHGSWDSGGLLQIGGQSGIVIHDNTFTQTARAAGSNGNIVNMDWYNNGFHYYNNKSYKPEDEAGNWNFHFESGGTTRQGGGIEIDHNEFHGGDCALDIGGEENLKGTYAFTWYVHDNYFTGTPEVNSNKQEICMEGQYLTDVWIMKNHFKDLPRPINQTNGSLGTSIMSNIYICYNIMENCGFSTSGEYMAAILFCGNMSSPDALSNIYFYNNVLQSSTSTHNTGIQIGSGATITNFNIKNNIIENCDNNGFLRVDGGSTFTGLYVTNNITYNNFRTTPLFTAGTPSSYIFDATNLTSNPSFTSSSDFHLQAGSPGINNGVYVSLTSDYAGAIVNNPPEIGVYEYGSTGTVPMTAFTLTSAGNATTITTYGGTLQFYTSNITPSNTTDQTFVWSVANGTGSGTISSSGLLTAVTNGTVTVRATAHDGSGVYNIMVITLSNQTVTGYPVVITTILTDVTPTTATLGGNVTSDGGLTVTNRGLCYGASLNPTTSNSVIQVGTGTGTFVATITGLTVGGTYHVRAFATNTTGTSYGADVVVTTRAKYIVTY